MKEMVSVRSNCYYHQSEEQKSFKLLPVIELIIIHTNGKEYQIKKNELLSSAVLSEIRLTASPLMLSQLITELQLHQKKLQSIQHNSEQLSALVAHITKPEENK